MCGDSFILSFDCHVFNEFWRESFSRERWKHGFLSFLSNELFDLQIFLLSDHRPLDESSALQSKKIPYSFMNIGHCLEKMSETVP